MADDPIARRTPALSGELGAPRLRGFPTPSPAQAVLNAPLDGIEQLAGPTHSLPPRAGEVSPNPVPLKGKGGDGGTGGGTLRRTVTCQGQTCSLAPAG